MNKLAAAILLMPAACAIDFANQPTAQLCVDYMAAPPLNAALFQDARAKELARRGENCAAYAEMAAARLQAQRNFQQAMQATSQALSAQAAAQRTIPNSTQTYFINGKAITCTTSGSITNCY